MDKLELEKGNTAEGFIFRIWKDDRYSWTYGFEATTSLTRSPRSHVTGRARTQQEAMDRIDRWSRKNVGVAVKVAV